MPRQWAQPQLLRMVEALRHESFYRTGTWVDESLGVYVGWAARKGSFSDTLPLQNERADAVLIFSGEVFSEPGTARRLKERGHAVDSDGPSCLVHLYEQDSSFPAGLNGLFHGLLADRKQGMAMLFNDRYGMHRLYFHEAKDAFYFSAEAKAVLEVRPELRKVNSQSLGEFITCGCTLENRTLFSGIEALPPGSAWTFRDGAVDSKPKYFDCREWEQQDSLDPETWYQELRKIFARNLPRYFDNGRHEGIGMSLTGGLDGRMILAWRKPAPGSLPCYTFGGLYRNCRDVIVARRVAQACDQPHQVITLGHDFLSRFSRYAERAVYLSDGSVEVNRAPALYANERAREIAPVRMTGNYGSEILRANRAFKPKMPLLGLFHSELLREFRQAQATYAMLARIHPVTFAAFRQAPWHHYGLRALEETQLCQRSPYLDNELVRVAFRAPRPAALSADTCLRLIENGSRALRLIRADRGLAGNHGRMIGAATRGFLEFTFKAEYAYDYGMPHWAARIDHAFSRFHLERFFLGRHKFYHFRPWYRDSLAAYVREMLLDSRTLSRPYLYPAMVEKIVDGHLKRGLNYTSEIHKILTLELIHRHFIDRR